MCIITKVEIINKKVQNRTLNANGQYSISTDVDVKVGKHRNRENIIIGW